MPTCESSGGGNNDVSSDSKAHGSEETILLLRTRRECAELQLDGPGWGLQVGLLLEIADKATKLSNLSLKSWVDMGSDERGLQARLLSLLFWVLNCHGICPGLHRRPRM